MNKLRRCHFLPAEYHFQRRQATYNFENAAPSAKTTY